MRIGAMEAVTLVVLLFVLVAFVVMGRQRRPASDSLEKIFGEPSSPHPGPKARLWALSTLHEEGVDSDADPVYAMKVLRQAEPRLTPVAAKALIDTLNRYA